MAFRISTLLFALLLISWDADAQSSANAQNTLLPEINPQDIEIRSEFRARFPGLRRQPILGFNPKPRIFRIDPNRMPFMESRDQAVASVAITQLDRPDPPVRTVISAPRRGNAYIKAGYGNFLTPEVNGYFYQGLNEKSNLSGNVNYSSSDGHLDNQLSSYRFLDADLQFSSKLSRQNRIEANVGGLYDFNRLYNLAPIYQDAIGETALKNYGGFNAGVSFTQVKNSLEGLTADLQFQTFNTEIEAGSTDLGGTTNEQRVSVQVKKYWPGNRLYETFSVDGLLTVGTYDNSSTALSNNNSTANILYTTLSAGYKKLLNFSMHVSANAGLAYVSDGFSNRVYVAPNALFTYNLKGALTLKAGLSGSVQLPSQQEHHQINRFLDTGNILRHSYESKVYSEVGLQLFEGNSVYGGLMYAITKNYAYYDREIETRIGVVYPLFYSINYDKATEFQLFGGITQQINPEQFWFDVRVYARRPSLESGGDIPFEERIGATTNVSFKPTNELLLSGWIDFVGSREAPASGENLDAFTLANVKVEYEFTSKFGVYAKVLNILAQEYEQWDGFEERPFQVFGGLILKF